MFSGFIFTIVRIFELLTLIPAWGILAYFVDLYQPRPPPDSILLPFVVGVLATVWALVTLLMYRSMRWTPLYVAIVDLCFFGVLIGGVVVLAPSVRATDCVSWSGQGVAWDANGLSANTGWIEADRHCMMLKAAWGLGIFDVLAFFFTAVLAWHVWHHTGVVVYEERPRRSRRGRW